MKTLISSLIGLTSVIYVHAINVEGRVVDASTEPIEFANVAAFAGDSIVAGCITDAFGHFSMALSEDCDSLRVTYIGCGDAVLSPVNSNMGDIVLRPGDTVIKEVVVQAPLIRREADRIVLNVAANPLSANKNVQDILKTAPGVWATDSSLSIYGQGGTAIYIDDRKVNMSGAQLITYLRSIQSSAIATIEIIPKAGAEYSAASAGGIIKINLKRNRIDGLTGTAGISTTVGEYKAWINPFANVSIHSGKWTMNVTGNMNGSPSDKYTTHESYENRSASLNLGSVSSHKKRTLQGNVALGCLYEATEKDKFGIQLDYNPDRNKSTATSQTKIISGLSDEYTLGNYKSECRFHNINVALNYSHLLDNKGSALKWNSNYNNQYSSTDESNQMLWLPVSRDSIYSTDNANRYNIFDTEISLQKNFRQGWMLSAGVKYTHNDVRYDSNHFNYLNDEWVCNTALDYAEKYREDIAAGYVTLNAQAGRWRFKAGLRGEYYHASGLDLSRSKFDLFPNANIALNLTERGDYTVAIGYYRNISRPSFWSLNPTVRQVSDYSYSVGNPYLRPSHVDAVSLDFVLGGKFTLAAGYSETSAPIRQMYITNREHPERTYLTWENIGKDRSGFIHGDGFVRVTKWWNLYASLTYAVTSQKLGPDIATDTFGYLQAVASTTITLPYSVSITINGFYQTKMKIGNITVYPILNIDPTIQKRVGTHCALSLGTENLLQRKGQIGAGTTTYDRFTWTKQHVAIKIGATYNFSTGKGFRAPRIEKSNDTSRLKKD